MGLERRLFQRKDRNIQTDKADDRAPHPLPVTKVEAGDRTKGAGKWRLYVEPEANKNDVAIGIVFWRRHVGSTIPTEELVSKVGDDAQSITPNVELTGGALAPSSDRRERG